MKKLILRQLKDLFIGSLSILISAGAFAQVETLSAGSFIINMGATNPNTVGNGLKPYGLIYDLMKNYNVPVKWVIGQSKIKDGADFIYDGVEYKGGTFIIPAEFRTAAVNTRITSWQAQGVIGTTTTSPITVDVHRTLKSVPKWTLDAANGSIAQGYLTNAGINLTNFPGAYNFKAVAALDCCDDFFVMPHADPTWSTHGRLFTWNKDCLGSIWAACHAVSALENSINPSNTAEQMNFLSTRTAILSPTPWPNNSLKLWGTHAGGTIPYTHQLPGDPVAQYLGTTDAAQLNGSEQIYIPKQSTDAGGASRWRPGSKIIAYDPTQSDVLMPDIANGNAAALIVYGRAFDDANRGYVMYEAGHSHNKGTTSDVAAQRAFFNFSFFQVQPKAPQLTFTGISAGQTIQGSGTITGLSVSASSPLTGITFSYQWRSSCGGSFSNSTGTTTNFTAPNVGGTISCVISCVVTDNCGRQSFQSFPVTILGATPPIANADVKSIDPGCGSVILTSNVLANDTDPDGGTLTLTQVNGNSGSFTTANGGLVNFTASGNITYTSAAGYVGTDILTYSVCDNTSPSPLCTNGTYTITIGNPVNLPNASNDAFTIAEDAIGSFNVLANDIPVVSGPLIVSAITSGPANGKISINTDNTITYLPNADFAGTDNFTYRVVNSLGYSRTATVTVTVTNDACDGATYQTGAPTSGTVTFVPATDTYLREDQTGRNYGSCTGILVDRETGKNLRGLLKFDLTGAAQSSTGDLFPATGATINSAVLKMYLTAQKSNTAFQIDAHRATAAWDEGTACDATGISNWLLRTGATNWGAVGGDFAAAESNTSVTNTTGGVGGTNRYEWAIPVMTQTWYNNSGNNNGLVLKFNVEDNGGNEVKTFGSRTAASLANYPQLSISWTKAASCSTIPGRAPLGNQDTSTTLSTSPVTFNVLNNDHLFSLPATALSISTAPIPAQGVATANLGAGTVTFTPNATFNGVATFQYTITTANGNDVVRVFVRVNNSPVNANDDNPAGQNSGVAQTVSVLLNDVDPEGSSLTVAIVTPPTRGTATLNGSNEVIYTPQPGFTGKDTLRYSVCEPSPACGSANCDTASIYITVLNLAPVATTDSKTILPCFANTINLLANDTDPENGALSVTNLSAVNPGTAGTVINNNDGTVTFTPTSGLTPLPSVVTFTYTVTDNGVSPQTSAPATVTITVLNPVNTAPQAVIDLEVTNMEQVLYAAVKDNDTDPENQTLTNPVITIAPLHGTATVNPVNGLIAYTPNPGYSGTDVLTYRICDIPIVDPNTCTSAPDLCATATLTITVVAPNTVIAVNDENSTWVNTPVGGATLSNDKDPEGDNPITFNGFFISGSLYSSGTQPVSGVDASGSPVANAGSLLTNADGTYTFTPANNFTGSVNIPYVIQDANSNTAMDTAFLRITVNPFTSIANSVIANNDENRTQINTPVSSTLLANDSDPQGNSFSLTSFQFDTDGDGIPDGAGTIGAVISIAGKTTAGTSINNAGTIIINADGSFTFTPANDFTGTVEIPYSITDALGAISMAILKIDILPNAIVPSNDPPFAGDDFKYTKLNSPVGGTAFSNDGDPNTGQTITVSSIGGLPVAGPTTVSTPNGSVIINPDGTYVYTPNNGYVGPDEITYSICDNGVPVLCANAKLHFLVGVNNSTDAVNDENSTWQDVNVSGGVIANDFDKEKNIQTFGSFLLQNLGGNISSGATISGTDKTGAPVANAGILSFAADGSYTFDPDPAFTGTVSIPYRLCDNGNLTTCDTAYLTITVDPLPTTGSNTVIANNDENISYGSSVSNNVLVNDRDPQNNSFTVTGVTGSSPGTSFTVPGIDVNGNAVSNAGTLVINVGGSYTYLPASGFAGSINVPYTITDALDATAQAILHIDVIKDPNGPQNDPPFAGDDFGYTTINKPITGNFINTDSDPNIDPVSYNGVTIVPAGPATPIGAPVPTSQGGTIQFYANGTYMYTPPAGYTGPDKVNYQICDVTPVAPQPLCADAVIHLLVGPGINIAGKIWDDSNGDVDDDGAAEPETNISGSLFVNLVNTSGNVVAVVPVANDGTYNLNDVTPGTNYSLVLSTSAGTIGQPAPAASLPSGWTNTGETRNGTIDLGVIGTIDARAYGFTNTINFDFGIEQLPESDLKNTTIQTPTVGQFFTLNGGSNPPVLSGSDAEDCAGACLLTSRSVIIDALPANSSLYYNGVLVTAGQLINNFDPSLLQIQITTATIGSFGTSFQYSFVDAAGKKDPTPATYSLNWLIRLPAEGLSLAAILNRTDVTLNWKTISESNSAYFEIERSVDNRNFFKVGNSVKALGSSNFERKYQMKDDISGLSLTDKIYYRIKLVDLDGKITYSNVVIIRIPKVAGIKGWPNPFKSAVTISFNLDQNTTLALTVTDMAGRTIMQKSYKASRGVSYLTLNSLDDLTNGVYILEVIDTISGNRNVIKLEKNH